MEKRYKTILATALITLILGMVATSFTNKNDKLEGAASVKYVDKASQECHEYIDERFSQHEKAEKMLEETRQRQLDVMQGDLTIIKNHILNSK